MAFAQQRSVSKTFSAATTDPLQEDKRVQSRAETSDHNSAIMQQALQASLFVCLLHVDLLGTVSHSAFAC